MTDETKDIHAQIDKDITELVASLLGNEDVPAYERDLLDTAFRGATHALQRAVDRGDNREVIFRTLGRLSANMFSNAIKRYTDVTNLDVMLYNLNKIQVAFNADLQATAKQWELEAKEAIKMRAIFDFQKSLPQGNA